MTWRHKANYPAHTVNAINRAADALERIAIALETGHPAVRDQLGVLRPATRTTPEGGTDERA